MSNELMYLPHRQLFKINVCRLCALIREKVLPIFDNAGSKVDIKLKECFPNLNIKKGDSKPQYICLDCITKLNMFNEFLHVIVESESKFDQYVKQYLEKENTLETALFQNNLANSTTWQDDLRTKEQKRTNPVPNDDGVIVLSKMDSSQRDSSGQDFLVMVELKYKAGSDLPCSPQDLEKTRNFSMPTNLFEQNQNLEKLECTNSQDQHKLNNTNDDSRVVKDKESFVCAICGKSFSRKTRLTSHLSMHTSIRPHKCDKCGKTFGTKWDLASHNRVHTKEFSCESCCKTFISGSKLARHLRTHTGERPFSCKDCGRGFGDRRNLENHIRIHTGVKPFSCTICGKAFAVKSHLNDHLTVHSMAPRFKCKHCGKTFRWRTNYSRHIKASHSSPETKQNL